MAIALSPGIDPATEPVHAPISNCASSFVYRSFDPGAAVQMPATSEQHRFHKASSDGVLLQFPKMPSQIERDSKWLNSYRYGIIHLGGENATDLRRPCEHATMLLGWDPPYVDYATNLSGLGDEWPAALETENSPGWVYHNRAMALFISDRIKVFRVLYSQATGKQAEAVAAAGSQPQHTACLLAVIHALMSKSCRAQPVA